MADNVLEILVKFIKNDAAAKQAAAEIESLRNKSASATDEMSKGAQKAAGHIHGMGRAVNLLQRQLGELGHLFHFVFNLPALAVAGVAIGIHKVTEFTKRWGELTEQTMAAMEKPITNIAEQFTTLEEERIKANAAFAGSFKQVDDFASAAVRKFGEIKKAIDAATDAEEKFLLAQAEGDKDKQAEIRYKFAARKGQSAAGAEAVITSYKEQQLAQANKVATQQGDVASHYAHGLSREQVEATLRAGTTKLDEQRAKQVELVKESKPSTFGLPKDLQQAVEDADVSKMEALQKLYLFPIKTDQIEAYISSLKTLAKIDDSLKDFADRKPGLLKAEAAFKALDEAIKKIDALTAEIDERKATATAVAPFQTRAAVLGAATAATERGQGAAAQQIMGAAAGADAILAGGRAAPGEAEAINALTKLYNLQTLSGPKVLAILSRMNDTAETFNSSLDNHIRLTEQRFKSMRVP